MWAVGLGTTFLGGREGHCPQPPPPGPCGLPWLHPLSVQGQLQCQGLGSEQPPGCSWAGKQGWHPYSGKKCGLGASHLWPLSWRKHPAERVSDPDRVQLACSHWHPCLILRLSSDLRVEGGQGCSWSPVSQLPSPCVEWCPGPAGPTVAGCWKGLCLAHGGHAEGSEGCGMWQDAYMAAARAPARTHLRPDHTQVGQRPMPTWRPRPSHLVCALPWQR